LTYYAIPREQPAWHDWRDNLCRCHKFIPAHELGSMPTTKSAKKRLRQSLERRATNRAVKSAMKTQVRKVREAVAAGDVAKAETELRLAAKKLDRAGVKRVIHPNAAARTKSRLSHLIRAAKGKAAAK
jgi:small subunit ribosomal protein S20